MERKIILAEVTELIESWLAVKIERKLNPSEKALILAAWEDRTYDDVAEELDLSSTYLKQKGQSFWKLLGLVLNQQVSKKKFKAVVLKKRAELIEPPKSLNRKRDSDSDPDPDSNSGFSQKLVVLGRKPPSIDRYFGYNPELADLRQSILENQCVVLLGAPGIGKTALASKLLESLKAIPEYFSVFIWQSVRANLSLESLLLEILRCLQIETSATDLESLIRRLIDELDQRSCVLVLDGVENILTGTDKSNPYGDNEDYRLFFQEIIEQSHSSSIILTSREPFNDLSFAETGGQSVRIINLRGLGKDSYSLLKSLKLSADRDSFRGLIELYRGNPLALKLVAAKIRSFFGGSVQKFLDCKTTWMGGSIKQALDDQFKSGYWSSLEREMIYFLATQEEESMYFGDVFAALQSRKTISMTDFIEATDILCDRSLLERTESEDQQAILSLQPIIKKYVLSDPSGIIQQSIAA